MPLRGRPGCAGGPAEPRGGDVRHLRVRGMPQLPRQPRSTRTSSSSTPIRRGSRLRPSTGFLHLAVVEGPRPKQPSPGPMPWRPPTRLPKPCSSTTGRVRWSRSGHPPTAGRVRDTHPRGRVRRGRVRDTHPPGSRSGHPPADVNCTGVPFGTPTRRRQLHRLSRHGVAFGGSRSGHPPAGSRSGHPPAGLAFGTPTRRRQLHPAVTPRTRRTMRPWPS